MKAADRAVGPLRQYAKTKRLSLDIERESLTTDLVADLLILACREGLDGDRIARMALSHLHASQQTNGR